MYNEKKEKKKSGRSSDKLKPKKDIAKKKPATKA